MSLEFLEKDLFKAGEGISYEEITKELIHGGKNVPFKTDIDNPLAFAVLETLTFELASQMSKHYSEHEKKRVAQNLKYYILGEWENIKIGTTAVDVLLNFMMSFKIDVISKDRLSRKEVASILQKKEEEQTGGLSKLMEKLG